MSSRNKKHPASRASKLGAEKLRAMVAEATVDAYGEEEQALGWECSLEEHLELPFRTKVLGVEVAVERVELRADNRIVAICTRGRDRQAIALADLPIPSPAPAGADWITAYRHFLGER